MTPTQSQVVLCVGSPMDMGRGQGFAMREQIHASRDFLLPRLEAFRMQQPRWVPFRAYRHFAERKAHHILATMLSPQYPAARERLAGIAQGAGVSPQAVHLLNALEPFLSSVGECTTCPEVGGACSAVAVGAARSAIGEVMVAHNFDYLPIVQPYYALRECRPANGLRALEFTVAPLAGAVDGINEAGLCITNDYAYTLDQPAASAAPITMVTSEALARCRTVTEAAEWIGSRPRWGGGLMMLADATGDIASLELSSTRHHLRRPAPNEATLFHTNCLSGAEMQQVQVPPQAVYTDRAPTLLRGRRLLESSEVRGRRFRQLLADAGKIGPNELAAIMADHGTPEAPREFNPCVHSNYWQTSACVQLFPQSRRMRVAFDTACRARYADIHFS